MNQKYAREIQDFRQNFSALRGKRIALYGIGRYTATLLEGLGDSGEFAILGLMDRDPANVGKEYFGLPVLSPECVKVHADAIVINTAGTYWNLKSPTPISNGGLTLTPPGYFSGSASGGVSQHHCF